MSITAVFFTHSTHSLTHQNLNPHRSSHSPPPPVAKGLLTSTTTIFPWPSNPSRKRPVLAFSGGDGVSGGNGGKSHGGNGGGGGGGGGDGGYWDMVGGVLGLVEMGWFLYSGPKDLGETRIPGSVVRSYFEDVPAQ